MEYDKDSYYYKIMKAKDPQTFILILLDNNPVYAMPMLGHYPIYPGGQCLSPICY
jgi:hypothetical protein